MELRPPDVQLPIKQIKDANLSWIRKDPGPHDDDLLKSLREEGMKLPILLTNELIVADGARRLLRAEQLHWREVPVLITTEWDVVSRYYNDVRELAAEGLPTEPMSWAELVELLSGPLDLLYRRRRLERSKMSRIRRAAQREATGANPPPVARSAGPDYIGEAAQVLGWKRSDLRSVREIYWSLASIEAREDAARKAAHQEGGAEAAAKVPYRAELLRGEALRLENDGGGIEGGLYSLLRKLRWIAAGKDPGLPKSTRAKRKVGEPTFAERKAAAAANPLATGRELDAQTTARLSQVLTNLGMEAAEYTHVRPSVLIGDARTAARDMKAAINQLNRLIRLIKQYADNLEESS